MKCKVCDGSGITKGYDAILGNFFDMKCFACDGSGEVDHYEEEKEEPLTNEEWFCRLSTEEKAKRIINIAVNSDCDYKTIVEWLKEIHYAN